MNRLGALLLALLALLALAAPVLRLHDPAEQHRGFVLAPPMPVHVRDADGHWRAPFVQPLRLVDRLSREYAADTESSRPLVEVLRGDVASGARWFPLGTDMMGRDLWSRLVSGARVSLGLAAVATIASVLLGLIAGGVSGYAGGWLDAALMRMCELVLILPTLYIVIAMRAALPLVMPPATLFLAMATVLAVAGTPQVARAVRAVVAVERSRDYVLAARAMGRRSGGILVRHLLPATREVLVAQALLLVPAFVLAEATLSFLGLGFDATTPSWGTMLQDAANIRAIAEYPWVLAPAGAIALTVLALNLVADGRGEGKGRAR